MLSCACIFIAEIETSISRRSFKMASVEDYAVLIAIIELGSITRAARKTGKSIAAVSRLLASFEKERPSSSIRATAKSARPPLAAFILNFSPPASIPRKWIWFSSATSTQITSAACTRRTEVKSSRMPRSRFPRSSGNFGRQLRIVHEHPRACASSLMSSGKY